MDVYTTHMSLFTSEDAVLCRVFPTSLEGATLSWFTKLTPNSIDSFVTLVVKFETQFVTSRLHHLTFITLLGIRQEKGKSLRTFVDRFSKVAMSIRNLRLDVAMHHMRIALCPGAFADNFCMQSAASLDELRKKVDDDRVNSSPSNEVPVINGVYPYSPCGPKGGTKMLCRKPPSGAFEERYLSQEKILLEGPLISESLIDVSRVNRCVGRPGPTGDRRQTRGQGRTKESTGSG